MFKSCLLYERFIKKKPIYFLTKMEKKNEN